MEFIVVFFVNLNSGLCGLDQNSAAGRIFF